MIKNNNLARANSSWLGGNHKVAFYTNFVSLPFIRYFCSCIKDNVLNAIEF